MDKKTLRCRITEKKTMLSEEAVVRASAALAEKLFKEPCYREARSIYLYLSFNQEVRTMPILERALRDGKRVAVPKVYGREMRFLWIDGQTKLAPSRYGVPEPIADEPVADDETALVLLPGLAFDRSGRRIGYGGGFYDTFLEKEPKHPLIALCFDFQMFDVLETEPHDIPVPRVLVERI